MYDVPTPTWEVSHTEPVHPDPSVAGRMYEKYIAPCGCKIYADPLSKALVLAHNSAYGCMR